MNINFNQHQKFKQFIETCSLVDEAHQIGGHSDAIG